MMKAISPKEISKSPMITPLWEKEMAQEHNKKQR